MSLTTAIITVIAFDLALLGGLAFVLRRPFRLIGQPSGQTRTQPAPRPAARRQAQRSGARAQAVPVGARD